MGRPPNIEKTTRLSQWFDRHREEISREVFASRLGIERQHVDRYARGERRPGLDTAFDMEDITRQVSGGSDVLEARSWMVPMDQRPKHENLPKSHDRRRSPKPRKPRGRSRKRDGSTSLVE
jgi:transcriptional regulator with XRE-family HTH domain